MATCKKCGKTLKDPKYDICIDCNQQRGSNGNAAVSPRSGPAKLPDGYLKMGYFDDEGYLRQELITEQPLALAQAFADINLTTGQLRRFYGHVRRAAQRLESGESFAAVRPAIEELRPLAAGAVGKAAGNNVGNYELFRQFIELNVPHATQDRDSFLKGFVLHFQYIVAYFTYIKPKG